MEAMEITKASNDADLDRSAGYRDGGEAGFQISSEKKADKIAEGPDMGNERKRRVKNDHTVFCLSNRTEPSITEMAESIGLWGRSWELASACKFEMSTGPVRRDVYKLHLSLCLCLEFRKEIQAGETHLRTVCAQVVSMNMGVDETIKRVMFMIMSVIGNIQSQTFFF